MEIIYRRSHHVYDEELARGSSGVWFGASHIVLSVPPFCSSFSSERKRDPAQSVYLQHLFVLFNQFWFIEFNYFKMINSSLKKVARGWSCSYSDILVFSFPQDSELMNFLEVIVIELAC